MSAFACKAERCHLAERGVRNGGAHRLYFSFRRPPVSRAYALQTNPGSRSSSSQRAFSTARISISRRLRQIEAHVRRRQCSSEASSALVKMATDRDVLSDEYSKQAPSSGIYVDPWTVSSPAIILSRSSTSSPASHGATKATWTSLSKSKDQPGQSPSTPSSSKSTKPV